MGFVYYARSMAGQSQADAQTTPANRFLHEIVCRAIRLSGHRPQFDIEVTGIDKASLSAAQYIYRRDLFWLERCKALIVEASEPSHGAGYEVAYARHCLRLVNILVVAQADVRVSAMLSGDLPVVRYRTALELEAVIGEYLSGVTL